MYSKIAHAILSVPVTWRWFLALTLAALIIVLSTMPGISRPEDNLFSWLYANTSTPAQKLMHVICYALLSFTWIWALESIASFKVRAILAVGLSLGLGVVLEWYQTQIPGRFGTIADILLNTLGVAVGLILAVLLL